MKVLQGVTLTDGINRNNDNIPLSTILDLYRREWNKPIPMNIGHDSTKTIGYSKLTGVYLEPGKAYLTNNCVFSDSQKELNQALELVYANQSNFCEQHTDDIELLVKKLEGVITSKYHVAPFQEAVAIYDTDIVKKLFPEWTNGFKDGLTDINDLDPVYVKNILIPGVFRKDGYLLFAHHFFRRSFSLWNSTNREFFSSFEKLRKHPNLKVQLALDMNVVGLPGTEHLDMEYQYIRGPIFNEDLKSIPEGVTCNKNIPYDHYSNIVETQFYWHEQDERRTFECEELCDRESITFDNGKNMIWGCRYVHSMLNPDSGLPNHLDGAVRLYDETQILDRLDNTTDISKCGKNSNYVKLWRIDNDFSILLWKELISNFYRENSLIGEYFGGVDSKYDEIKKEQLEHKSSVDTQKKSVAFNNGDGVRVFLHYANKIEIDSDIIIKGELLTYTNGDTNEVTDVDVITLLKLLKRRGLVLTIPSNLLFLDCFDNVCNFPTMYCKNGCIVSYVLEAIKELCCIWMKKNNNITLSFAIVLNQAKEAVYLSFIGRIEDLAKLLINIKKYGDLPLEEWIENVYKNNNQFKLGGNFPDKFKLLHGNLLNLRRNIVPPNIIQNLFNSNLSYCEVKKVLHKIASNNQNIQTQLAPFWLIKKLKCKKCGGDYLKCSCVQYVDNDVSTEVIDAKFMGITWAN